SASCSDNRYVMLVPFKLFICRQDCQIMCLCSSDNHSVKRITMVFMQRDLSVFGYRFMTKRYEIESIFFSYRYDVRNINIEVRELTNRLFNCDFVEADIRYVNSMFAVSNQF